MIKLLVTLFVVLPIKLFALFVKLGALVLKLLVLPFTLLAGGFKWVVLAALGYFAFKQLEARGEAQPDPVPA